ncbi:MAG: Holliday junction resolvase RuvX [Patescibacteria group bacterium]
MRVLGIDYGAKRVGIALGDTESKIANPWGTLTNEGALALIAKIHEIVVRDLVETIIVGIPRPLRDSSHENEQVREVRKFIAGIEGLGVPVHEQDETLSSKMAARQAAEMGEREKRDDLAASNILQTWLDKQ